jgi:predicted dehydrogenase
VRGGDPRDAEVYREKSKAMINFGVIGCGGWGPNHVRNFNSVSDCKVKLVADIDVNRLARITEMFPDLTGVSDYQEVLNAADIDAVVIATPTSTHADIVCRALNAGKHVLCEKPLCVKAADGERLAQMAAQLRLVLMVGNVFLFNPGIIKVKELLDSGETGTLRYLSAVRTNLGPIRQDVNAAYDLATHDIAIFNWLMETQPQWVSATGASYLRSGVEDVVFITLAYPGNVLASIQASWLNPKKVRQITAVGSKRMITWDDLELSHPVAIYDRGASATPEYNDFGEFLRVSMWDGEVRLPRVIAEEPLRAQAQYFADSIVRGEARISNGVFSAAVVRTVEAVNNSIRTGGNPVPLNGICGGGF